VGDVPDRLKIQSPMALPATRFTALSRMASMHPRRHPFTLAEDELLLGLVQSQIYDIWSEIAEQMPGRSARQCRDRWANYLAPAISFAPFLPEEDELIVQKVNEIGTRWATIAKFANGRTGNALKNRWYARLRSRCFRDAAGKWVLTHEPAVLDKLGPKTPSRDSLKEIATDGATPPDSPKSPALAFPSLALPLRTADIWPRPISNGRPSDESLFQTSEVERKSDI
jgi:hypothetical protein